MYGQWVDVTVLPAQTTPESVTVIFPSDPRNVTSMDVTASEDGGRRRGKKRTRRSDG
jgi:hypothetical protein